MKDGIRMTIYGVDNSEGSSVPKMFRTLRRESGRVGETMQGSKNQRKNVIILFFYNSRLEYKRRPIIFCFRSSSYKIYLCKVVDYSNFY